MLNEDQQRGELKPGSFLDRGRSKRDVKEKTAADEAKLARLAEILQAGTRTPEQRKQNRNEVIRKTVEELLPTINLVNVEMVDERQFFEAALQEIDEYILEPMAETDAGDDDPAPALMKMHDTVKIQLEVWIRKQQHAEIARRKASALKEFDLRVEEPCFSQAELDRQREIFRSILIDFKMNGAFLKEVYQEKAKELKKEFKTSETKWESIRYILREANTDPEAAAADIQALEEVLQNFERYPTEEYPRLFEDILEATHMLQETDNPALMENWKTLVLTTVQEWVRRLNEPAVKQKNLDTRLCKRWSKISETLLNANFSHLAPEHLNDSESELSTILNALNDLMSNRRDLEQGALSHIWNESEVNQFRTEIQRIISTYTRFGQPKGVTDQFDNGQQLHDFIESDLVQRGLKRIAAKISALDKRIGQDITQAKTILHDEDRLARTRTAVKEILSTCGSGPDLFRSKHGGYENQLANKLFARRYQ